MFYQPVAFILSEFWLSEFWLSQFWDCEVVSVSSKTDAIEWRVSDRLVPYEDALAFMDRRVGQIRDGAESEMIWLLEHPPLYTAGTSASPSDLLDAGRFPVFDAGRGGQYTYHGPGQRVAYVMLDLKKRGNNVRRFVCDLEDWMIQTVAAFNVTAERREGRVGIWVGEGVAENKIGAIGVRVRKWVTFHGIALNVEPDLEHFSGIVPCGVPDHGVTSLANEGIVTSMADVDIAMRAAFETVFGLGTEEALAR